MNIAFFVATIILMVFSEAFYRKTSNSPFFYFLWGVMLPFKVTSNWPIYALIIFSMFTLLSLDAFYKRNLRREIEVRGAVISFSGLFIGLVIGWIVEFF
jgi:hypothetical protein